MFRLWPVLSYVLLDWGRIRAPWWGDRECGRGASMLRDRGTVPHGVRDHAGNLSSVNPRQDNPYTAT
jgi:hypothetical protein